MLWGTAGQKMEQKFLKMAQVLLIQVKPLDKWKYANGPEPAFCYSMQWSAKYSVNI
jgi:hypothetical protein